MQEINPKDYTLTVTQHNHLIRAKYDYTLREIKTARLIVSKVNPLDAHKPDGFLIEIRPDEAKSIYASEGKQFKDVWGVFRKSAQSLNSKPVSVNSPLYEGDLYLVSTVIRNKENGNYYVRVNPDFNPFISALTQGEFTTIPLRLYAQFGSKYMIRFYEELYSNRSLRGGIKRYKHWTDLAKCCGWDGTKYSHFKNRILLKGQEQFPTFTPLSFDFEEIKKKGTKIVQGLICTITTIKPKETGVAQTLFPEMSDTATMTRDEIYHQLVAWSVNPLTIEKLLSNPFQYIENATIAKKVKEKYDKLGYLWEKMEYVAHAQNIQDEAKYLIAAIKNNYTNKRQSQKKEQADRIAFNKQQQAELATIEKEVGALHSMAINVRMEITIQILEGNPVLMEEIFKAVAQQYDWHTLSIEELKVKFHQKTSFCHRVIDKLKEHFPDKFETIDASENKQLKALNKKKSNIRKKQYVKAQ